MAIDTLLPKRLDKSGASYQSVTELEEALSLAKKENIRNIALTGPFGSGKSSVLITLMEDFAEKYKFLPISLATLQANEEDNKTIRAGNQEEEPDEAVPEKERRTENLNRKIEYSILQQLIYREKTRTVPNSRFRRIVHLSKRELFGYPFCCVLTLLCFLVVFEPSFARVDSLYDFFNFGNKWNTFFDFIASGWLLSAMFWVTRYVLKSYSNSHTVNPTYEEKYIYLAPDGRLTEQFCRFNPIDITGKKTLIIEYTVYLKAIAYNTCYMKPFLTTFDPDDGSGGRLDVLGDKNLLGITTLGRDTKYTAPTAVSGDGAHDGDQIESLRVDVSSFSRTVYLSLYVSMTKYEKYAWFKIHSIKFE